MSGLSFPGGMRANPRPLEDHVMGVISLAVPVALVGGEIHAEPHAFMHGACFGG